MIIPQTRATRATTVIEDGMVILNAFSKYCFGINFVIVTLSGIDTF
jgi:hypothetical protein